MQDHPCVCSRREFLIKLAGTAVAVSMAGELLNGCALKPVSPPSAGTETLSLDDPKYATLQNVGGAVKLPWKDELPIIVVQNPAGSYEAFSSTCTHAGCEVDLPSGGIIQCPCHGSTFNLDGHVLSRPARSNLFPASSVSLSGRILSVTFG